jgi:heptosyltransferase-3
MTSVRGNRTLRFFDRYAGIPLIAALGLLPKRRQPAPQTVGRIGLMKTVAIGDTVLLAGVVADVRSHFPSATLVLINGEDNAAVGRLMLADRDEQIVISPHRPVESMAAIRAARLDILLDFGAWPRFDATLSALSGSRFRVGFRTAGQGRHFAYDRTVDYSGTSHEVENNRRLAGAIGVASATEPTIVPPRLLPADGAPTTPYAVLHPWAGGLMPFTREWPSDRWVDLAREIARRDWSVVVSGGPADREPTRNLAGQMRASGLTVIDAAGRHTIPELADLLAGSEIVVSVNTGVMHLAAAVGARTVGLQGPTSSRRWGPLGRRARAVDSVLPGCGYLNLGWEYAGQRLDCMNGVAVDAVVNAIDDLVRSDRRSA